MDAVIFLSFLDDQSLLSSADDCFITVDMLAASDNRENDFDSWFELSMRAEGVRQRCVQNTGLGGWAVSGKPPQTFLSNFLSKSSRRVRFDWRLCLRPQSQIQGDAENPKCVHRR